MSSDKDQPRLSAPSSEAPKTFRTTAGVGSFGAFTPITSLTIPKSRYQHKQRVSRYMQRSAKWRK